MDKQCAELVFFEGKEQPCQYAVYEQTMIGYGEPKFGKAHRISLKYDYVAPREAVITYKDNKWIFKNLPSPALVYVNSMPAAAGEEIELLNGDIIRLTNGGHQLIGIFLDHYMEEVEWRSIPLDEEKKVVHIYGHMAEDSEEAIDEVRRTGKDQEHQAVMRYKGGKWRLYDIHTTNGVYVNRERVEGSRNLQTFDVITIGDTVFVYENQRLIYNRKTARQNRLAIHIEERSVFENFKKKTLLKDINLSIEPGSMVLILGGSGAGKSTFVNAVTGYEKAAARIEHGGVNVYEHYDRMKYEIGFVPQQNLLRGDDKVEDTLENAADMRLPKSISKEEKEKRVKEVLQMFGLETVRHSLVEKLSGGQKKRLSIGVEFIANPSLFILDEPDSGLDGVMARDLMKALRGIADQGKIVMVITHTPDRVIDLFDKVIVLAKNSGGESGERTGQLAFYGSVEEAKEFFARSSMEDIVRAVNNKDEGGDGLADAYIEKFRKLNQEEGVTRQGKTENGENLDPRGQRLREHRHTGRLGQIGIYLGKHFRLFLHDHEWKVLIMAAVISLLISFVCGHGMYKNMEDMEVGAFAVALVCIWNGFFNSIQNVVRERSIIKREHRAGLHISAYILSHMIYQAFLCACQTVIMLVVFALTGVAFPAYGVITDSFVFDMFITIFLITYSADMLALMVSCFVRTTTSAMTVMPFLLILQLVFAGVAFPLDASIKPIGDLMVSRWGVNALNAEGHYNYLPCTAIRGALYQFNDIPVFKKINDYIYSKENNLAYDVDILTARYRQNEDYVDTAAAVAKEWAALAGYALLYAAVGTASLEFIDRDKR